MTELTLERDVNVMCPVAGRHTIGKKLKALVNAAGVSQVAVGDAAAAAGDPPTKAEFDALVNLANANKAAINALINALSGAAE